MLKYEIKKKKFYGKVRKNDLSLESCTGTQKFILIPSRPRKNTSHHCWYRHQSTFNEHISLIIPEYLRWCIIVCCHGNWIH